MGEPLPLPSVIERTKRLKALEKWREKVDGRISDVEVRFSRLRQGYTDLHDAYVDNREVRKACKESVANLQYTMQTEIAYLQKEIEQLKKKDDEACLATVRNLETRMQKTTDALQKEIDQLKKKDDEVVYVKTEPAKKRKRQRIVRLKL